MTKPLVLPIALAALLLALPEAPAHAQGVTNTQGNTRAAKRARQQAQAPAEAKPNYPKATRVAPKQVGDNAVKKKVQELIDLQSEEDSEDRIIAKAGEILADSRANAYDKSSAAYIAGAAWQSKSDDYDNAIKFYEQAIEFNGLSNNNHYLAMLQVAQLLNADGKSEQALKWIDRFLSETQSDDKTALGVKYQILLTMDKPELAIPFLEKQAAANPDDTKLQMNLASVYLQAEQEAKAMEILDRLRKSGKFTETSQYEAAWRLLASTEGREKDALAVIDEGMQKGLLKPSYDIYTFQAQTWYGADDMDRAVEAWGKAAPLGKDGQGYLNLAQGQQIREKWSEARAAAKTALDKGVRQPGQAWRVISIAESSLGNKAAAAAAAREAAKYPDTKKWADATLKASGGK